MNASVNAPSRKKPAFPIGEGLLDYLRQQERLASLPVRYQDLLRFTNAIPLTDCHQQDTLWDTVLYEAADMELLYDGLARLYALLKAGGESAAVQHLSVARIDYCAYGNSQPFRVRIVNQLNDNYDHIYIKQVDASRIYGLELEYLLSPNHLHYLVGDQTLVEEHVVGVPGERFMARYLEDTPFNQTRMAKEFVKFNERTFARLLGDMRAYNFVVEITPDLEGNQYRLRAIDFDQQSYEGRKSMYLPQYFKENNPLIRLGMKLMEPATVAQYQQEERSLLARRASASRPSLDALLDCMAADVLSTPEKTAQLAAELARYHRREGFRRCRSMGDILRHQLAVVLQDHPY
jgi:hypothetical protein